MNVDQVNGDDERLKAHRRHPNDHDSDDDDDEASTSGHEEERTIRLRNRGDNEAETTTTAIETKLSHNATTRQKQRTTSAPTCERALVVRLLLPLIFVFLLPTFRLEQREQSSWTPAQPEVLLSVLHETEHTTGALLMELIRLPLDRIRLEAAGLMLGASAKEISTKADLQEEETHMLLLAPAEHRASYVAAPISGGPAHGYPHHQHHQHPHHYESGESGQPQGEMHVQALPGGEYGGSGAGAGDGGGTGEPVASGQVGGPGSEATAISDTAVGQASALQARSDLPAVRALNVKCEKNHMTVSI